MRQIINRAIGWRSAVSFGIDAECAPQRSGGRPRTGRAL